MSLIDHGQIIIDYISFRKTKIRKQKFEKYLSILYDSLKSTCGFTKEVFLFLFPNIPYLIREKFYELLLKKRIQTKNIFTKQIFIETFLSIMYHSTKSLFKLFLDFFDYTNDSIIYSDDVNVIFYHIHHHNGNSDKLIYIKKFIFDVFSYKKFLKKKEFKFIIKEKNSNLFYLFIFSLIYSLFKKKDIYEACENLHTELNIKTNPLLLIKEESLYDKFQIVPPTQDLIEYLNQKFKVNLIDDQPIKVEINDENSLDDLNDFEQDIIYIKHNFTNKTKLSSDLNIRNTFKKPLKTYSEKPNPLLYSFPSKIPDEKKIKIRLSFSPSIRGNILSQFTKKISYPKKNFKICNIKKGIKAKTKELTLSFVKSTLQSNRKGKKHRKTIYPKDVIYPFFESILYFSNQIMKDVVLRVFESFIIIEENFARRIIPTTKLFFLVDNEPKEYNNIRLFPLKLISQLSYQKKVLYNLYFLSFQNREKFIYQLKCILGDFIFKKQFILDKPLFESNQYSVYLGRKNNIDESPIIKIKNSRLEELDDFENCERFHIKIISKNNINNLKNLIDEFEISKLLSNITYPNINNIENIFEDNENIYIIFEEFDGETISSLGNYTVTQKYELVKQLYKGVKSLHNIGIIHTNLIPELIFVNDYQQILITRINEAHLNLLFESNSLIFKGVKNYKYDCPEIIEEKKCNFKVDYWNIGLITFYLLYGYCPIDKDNYYTFDIEKIIKEINLDQEIKKKRKIDNVELFKSLNSLIINCINKDPENRGDEIEDILNIKRTQNRIKV